MGFAITVPNANQSPGVFPTQCNDNFQRIFDVVNAEHIFNTVFAANDGTHRVVSLVNKSVDPSIPAGTNGVLFTKTLSLTGQSELFWRNAARVQQLTALEFSQPIRITGTVNLPNGVSATHTIFANPGYDYSGTVTAFLNNSTTYTYNFINKSGTFVFERELDSHLGATANIPDISYSGQNLIVTNTTGGAGTRDIVWSIIINRL